MKTLVLLTLLLVPVTAWAGSDTYQYSGNLTSDTAVKSSAGFLHTVTCGSDAAATAGTLIIYDNTAESGTQIFNWTFSATEIQPRTLIFDVAFGKGLYMGFTTTGDVSCTVTYR